MGRAVSDVTQRAWVALVATAMAVLVVLAPSLLMTSAAESGTLALAVVTLALATLVRLELRSVALAGSGSAAQPVREGAPLVLAVRVTDPVHHPLRPRAPGTV